MLINKLKFNKKTVIVFIIVIITIGLYSLNLLLNEEDNTKTSIITITPTQNLIQKLPTPTLQIKNSPPGTTSSSLAYFMNTVGNNKKPANGYSWLADKLIYSSKNGVYFAASNEIINEISINNIYWSKNAKAILKSGNKWYFLDCSKDGDKLEEIKNNLINPTISPLGSKYFQINNNKITVFGLSDNTSFSKEFETNIESAYWSSDENLIVVNLNKDNKTLIYLFDNNLNEKENVSLDSLYKMSSVSPRSDIIIFYNTNELIIYKIQGSGLSMNIREGSEIVSEWISDSNFILIETYKDYADRKINNVYKINSSGAQEFLIDSKPIIKRLNTQIKISTNNEKNVLPLIDGGGEIWLLSLLINKIPFYNTEGLFFSLTENKGI